MRNPLPGATAIAAASRTARRMQSLLRRLWSCAAAGRQAGSIPWRARAAAPAGPAIHSSSARTASGWLLAVAIPPEKVVTICTPGGNGPTTSIPGTCISSDNCWNPSATRPSATTVPTGTPGGAWTIRGEICAPQRFLAVDLRSRRTRAHRDRDPRPDQVDPAAGDDPAGGDQLVDRLGGEHDRVEHFAVAHPLGRIDPAHRFEHDPAAVRPPRVIRGQFGEQRARGHRRDEVNFGLHGPRA